MRILKRENRIIKRVFDIVVASILFALFLPIMLIVSLGVLVSLGRPVIFRQVRVGQGEREFEMLKFRTMRDGSDADHHWTTGDESRKTRFGNFLRRTSLDELPQLLNVLKGEMSLVGPRPEMPFFVKKFKSEMPDYGKRHLVKPGITGLSQIRGLRGDTSLTDRLSADISYIKGWSVWLDIWILIKTPFKMLNRKEVYRSDGKN